ncbi:MAG: aspartate carbamoyltransferase catalytic subunit [Candidatus Omnitrophica bacterium]|nr:aspartate carbamoyltransferase catalytic subunit [Candidatus Omnitrophota bacterium]
MDGWQKKHLLGIKDLSRQEIEIIFELAASFKELSQREVKKAPALRGKTMINLFFESSTRTRTSFELAAKRLSADVLNFSSSSSSLSKGESLEDTIKNLEAYHPDILVIRIGYSECLHNLSRYTLASIVNAGDGNSEHPTQALLDMFTVKEIKGKLDGLSVLIVGDITHSRVARSNIFGFQKFSAHIKVCGPSTLIPYEFDKLGVEISYDFDEAIRDADVIIMLRIQKERQEISFFPSIREYVEKFALTAERIKKIKKDCIIMHPGPVNWDVEISSQLKEELHPLILKQVENGLAIRMAVLYLAGTKKRKYEDIN